MPVFCAYSLYFDLPMPALCGFISGLEVGLLDMVDAAVGQLDEVIANGAAIRNRDRISILVGGGQIDGLDLRGGDRYAGYQSCVA